jgi:hypothetical protein
MPPTRRHSSPTWVRSPSYGCGRLRLRGIRSSRSRLLIAPSTTGGPYERQHRTPSSGQVVGRQPLRDVGGVAKQADGTVEGPTGTGGSNGGAAPPSPGGDPGEVYAATVVLNNHEDVEAAQVCADADVGYEPGVIVWITAAFGAGASSSLIARAWPTASPAGPIANPTARTRPRRARPIGGSSSRGSTWGPSRRSRRPYGGPGGPGGPPVGGRARALVRGRPRLPLRPDRAHPLDRAPGPARGSGELAHGHRGPPGVRRGRARPIGRPLRRGRGPRSRVHDAADGRAGAAGRHAPARSPIATGNRPTTDRECRGEPR